MYQLIKLFLASSLVAIAACTSDSNGGGGETTGVEVTCADVHNTSQSGNCVGTATAVLLYDIATAATINIDAGTISRTSIVNTTIEVVNSTPDDVRGHVEMAFSAGCNGAPTWEIVPKQPYNFIANQTTSLTVGAGCTDMPLGTHTMTAKAWDADGVTQLGEVIVTFLLVE